MSSSRRKNPAPKSSSSTSSSSRIVKEPVPARTMFLHASVAMPRKLTIRTEPLRILSEPHRNLSVEEGAAEGGDGPILGFETP